MIVVVVETEVKSSDGVIVDIEQVSRILARADAVYYNGSEANRRWLEDMCNVKIGRFTSSVLKGQDVRSVLFDPDSFRFALPPRYWYKTLHGLGEDRFEAGSRVSGRNVSVGELERALIDVRDELYEYIADYNPDIEWGDIYVFRFRFDFDNLHLSDEGVWRFFNDDIELVDDIVYDYLEKKIKRVASRFNWIRERATLDELKHRKSLAGWALRDIRELVIYSSEPLESEIMSKLEKVRSGFWIGDDEQVEELLGLVNLVRKRIQDLRQLEEMVREWEEELNSDRFWREQYDKYRGM